MTRATKCPVCGSQDFFVKDPVDEYETYSFQCRDGRVVFGPEGELPSGVEDGSETFCEKCSWHGEFCKLKE